MSITVIQHLVVNFVGENNQLVLARNLDNFQQQGIGIQRTGGIVRINDDNRASVRGDLAAHVIQVRHPLILLVAHIVPRRAASQCHGGCPQRVIRSGYQHLVAHIQQTLHRHRNQLGGTVADKDIIHSHTGNFLLLRVVHDRLACGEHAFRVGISGRVRHVVNYVLLDLFGRFKAKRCQVADIQLDNAMTILFHLFGSRHDRAANVIADIRQLGRFHHGAHSIHFSWFGMVHGVFWR